MLRVSNRTSQAPRTAPVRLSGMRRVSWVRFTVVDGHARCEAVGMGHRRPAVRRVSIDTAVALVSSGVPSVIRSGGGDASPVEGGD